MKRYFLFISLILIVSSCVSAYDITIKASKGYFVIDGRITDLDEVQSLTISRTNPTAEFSTNDFVNQLIGHNIPLIPAEKLNVVLIVNASSSNRKEIPFTETSAGFYQLPADFRAKVGNTYQLKFKSAQANYLSSEEKMLPVAPIKNIYDAFNLTGIANNISKSSPSNDIFIDYDDPVTQTNFYQWKWINWEIQSICASCKQGRYYWYPNQQGEKGDCFKDLSIEATNIYDYPCFDDTWDIFNSPDLNIIADTYTNGQAQKGVKVCQIPLRQSNPVLVAIQQMSLTPDAFRYFKLMKSNVTNTGTLADTPPASIQGNVYNSSNPNEVIIGYFSVSSVSETRYMVNRRNTKGGIYNNLFFYETSRTPNYDPLPHPQPRQSAVGTESPTRTIIKPKGWIG